LRSGEFVKGRRRGVGRHDGCLLGVEKRVVKTICEEPIMKTNY
jgi:hypothetical protein